jgi:hypothetical protein
MDYKKLSQGEAIKMLEANEDISAYKVVFNEEKVEALKAILLGKNKINVPEELIYYNDDVIDFSEDPDLTQEDLESGKLIWNIKASLLVDKEMKDWIVKEKIDVDKLLIKLMRNFYDTVKDFPTKAAF